MLLAPLLIALRTALVEEHGSLAIPRTPASEGLPPHTQATKAMVFAHFAWHRRKLEELLWWITVPEIVRSKMIMKAFFSSTPPWNKK